MAGMKLTLSEGLVVPGHSWRKNPSSAEQQPSFWLWKQDLTRLTLYSNDSLQFGDQLCSTPTLEMLTMSQPS